MENLFRGIVVRVAGVGLLLGLVVPPVGARPGPDNGQPGQLHTTTSARTVVQREPRAILITFEDAEGPCHFPEATPLRNRYVESGVTFSGPEETNGGAILGSCSKFGVEGFGGYRFLAFNSVARLMDGSIPKGPETLDFAWPIQKIELLVGSPAPGNATMTCFDEAGPVDSATIDLSPVLHPLTVSGSNMVRCVLSFDAPALVVDNLRFTPQDPLPIPAQTPLGVVLLVLLLALAGVAALTAP